MTPEVAFATHPTSHLQLTATALQHTVTLCNTQDTRGCSCNTPHLTFATHCNSTATHCNTLQHTCHQRMQLQHTTPHICNSLQQQRNALLQRVAAHTPRHNVTHSFICVTKGRIATHHTTHLRTLFRGSFAAETILPTQRTDFFDNKH